MEIGTLIAFTNRDFNLEKFEEGNLLGCLLTKSGVII